MKTLQVEAVWLEANPPVAAALLPCADVFTAPIILGAGPGIEGETHTAEITEWRDVPDVDAQAAYDMLCAWMQQHNSAARHICVRMLHVSD